MLMTMTNSTETELNCEMSTVVSSGRQNTEYRMQRTEY